MDKNKAWCTLLTFFLVTCIALSYTKTVISLPAEMSHLQCYALYEAHFEEWSCAIVFSWNRQTQSCKWRCKCFCVQSMVSGSIFMTMVINWLSVTEWILRRLFLPGQMLHHGTSLSKAAHFWFHSCHDTQTMHVALVVGFLTVYSYWWNQTASCATPYTSWWGSLSNYQMQRVVTMLLNFC